MSRTVIREVVTSYLANPGGSWFARDASVVEVLDGGRELVGRAGAERCLRRIVAGSGSPHVVATDGCAVLEWSGPSPVLAVVEVDQAEITRVRLYRLPPGPPSPDR